MTAIPGGAAVDLLSGLAATRQETLTPGATILRGFCNDRADALLNEVNTVVGVAPFRHMVTPGGHTMSVAMTNAGRAGWVTDLSGYRYANVDPRSGTPWPPIPPVMRGVAQAAANAAGFAGFDPDAALINRYVPGARLTLHQDRNERDRSQPIVSVSLGLPAVFVFGGLRRTDRVRRLRLDSGDVVVWGGPARLAYHGVETLADGVHETFGRCRYNVTFRMAL